MDQCPFQFVTKGHYSTRKISKIALNTKTSFYLLCNGIVYLQLRTEWRADSLLIYMKNNSQSLPLSITTLAKIILLIKSCLIQPLQALITRFFTQKFIPGDRREYSARLNRYDLGNLPVLGSPKDVHAQAHQCPRRKKSGSRFIFKFYLGGDILRSKRSRGPCLLNLSNWFSGSTGPLLTNRSGSNRF